MPLNPPSPPLPPSLSPLVTTSLFSVSVSLLLFCFILVLLPYFSPVLVRTVPWCCFIYMNVSEKRILESETDLVVPLPAMPTSSGLLQCRRKVRASGSRVPQVLPSTRPLYSAPGATATKCHKLGGLKRQTFIVSSPGGWDLRLLAGLFPLRPLSWCVDGCLLPVSSHSRPSAHVCVLTSSAYKDPAAFD